MKTSLLSASVVAVFLVCSLSRAQVPVWSAVDLLSGAYSSEGAGPPTGTLVEAPYMAVSHGGGIAAGICNEVNYSGITGSYMESWIATCTAHGEAWANVTKVFSGTNGVGALAVSPEGKIRYALVTNQNLTLTTGAHVLAYPQPGGGEPAGTHFGAASGVLALRYDTFGKLGFLLDRGSDSGFYFYRSDDDGSTWTSGVRLDTQTAPTAFGTVAALGGDASGNWIACWETEAPPASNDSDLYVSRSSDDGDTWSTPVPLHTAMESDVEPDTQPDIEAGFAGEWMIVWTSHVGIGTDYDVVVSRSSDEGASWSAPQPLLSDFLTDTVPEVSPSISCDARTTWMVTWSGAASISTDFGNTWNYATIDSPYEVSGDLVNDGTGWWLMGSRFTYSYFWGDVNPMYATLTRSRVWETWFNPPATVRDWRLYD